LLRETVIFTKQIRGSLSDSLKSKAKLARKNHGKSRSDERIVEWLLPISPAEPSYERTARENFRAANHRLVQLMLL
jgi:hypothetical protein